VFRGKFSGSIPVFVTLALFLSAPHGRAQDPQDKPPAAPAKPAPKPNKDSATQNAPDQPAWDPLRAEKDIEVGQHWICLPTRKTAQKSKRNLKNFGKKWRKKRRISAAVPGPYTRCSAPELARQPIQDAAGALEFGKTLFFHAKFPRM
jgi:hypothetical protein